MDGDKTKLFVICGHGAGDPGACGNGYQEAERVRALGKRIKELGGSNVMLGDVNRDYYADNGISKLTIAKDYQIIELHMDSAAATARGAHVIIKDGLNADKYDTALAKFISGVFPGRANTLVKRGDLANPARAYAKGYAYRLMECGFISNATDVSIFNKNIDKIAKGILQCFGIGVQAAQKPAASKPTPKPAAKPKTQAKKQTVTLPASAASWRVYKTNVAPVVGNECGKLLPSKFGGLTYEIIGKPQTDVVTIQTRDFGKVNIFVGKGTGAIIK